jgi:hypothetical protein
MGDMSACLVDVSEAAFADDLEELDFAQGVRARRPVYDHARHGSCKAPPLGVSTKRARVVFTRAPDQTRRLCGLPYHPIHKAASLRQCLWAASAAVVARFALAGFARRFSFFFWSELTTSCVRVTLRPPCHFVAVA